MKYFPVGEPKTSQHPPSYSPFAAGVKPRAEAPRPTLAAALCFSPGLCTPRSLLVGQAEASCARTRHTEADHRQTGKQATHRQTDICTNQGDRRTGGREELSVSHRIPVTKTSVQCQSHKTQALRWIVVGGSCFATLMQG